MYIPDLSAYSYDVSSPIDNVATVGWLDIGMPFTKGKLPSESIEKLKIYCAQFSIRMYCGFHPCPFCGVERPCEGNEDSKIYLGSAEIWIPSSGRYKFYAAPNMILHYCLHHDYLPPDNFVVALMNVNINFLTRKVILGTLRGVSMEVADQVELESLSPEETVKLILEKRKAMNDKERKLHWWWPWV